jgi:hypothetical protein
LFTFYSNITNSDKNTLFGTFLIKIRQEEQGSIRREKWPPAGSSKYITNSCLECKNLTTFIKVPLTKHGKALA